MGVTRRALLGTGAAAAVLCAFGGAVRLLGGTEELLRPPTILNEADFNSKCIRCYRCISVCPTGVVVPATLNDGLLAMKTPTMDFHRGICDFCNKCVEACPTSALCAADPYDPVSGRIGYALVQTDRCLAYNSGCLACAEACPYDAITLDSGNHPVVDTDKCNGCGTCENICPALVYRTFSGGSRRGIVVVKNETAASRLLTEMEA